MKGLIERTSVSLAIGLALVGCMPGGERAAPATGGEAEAPNLDLRPGMEISVTQTWLGLGAGLASWTGDETGIKNVSVVTVGPDELVVSWREEVQEETAASRRRREAFERDPPKSGVGEPEPVAPEPELEMRSRAGRITASNLAASRQMALPALWPEGEHSMTDSSLIWLSRSAFRELRDSLETRWSLGLLQSSLWQPVAAVANLQDALLALEERIEGSAEERQGLDRIEAEADFGTLALTIDGERREVQTIVAGNWLARYQVLDDEDNPLILKITLNPLSGGALDIFSPLGALKAVVGYQVTAIRTGS